MTSGTRGIGKSVHSPDQAAFCELMVGARKAAGLTQHALARRLNKPQSFVAKYEGGERRLDVVEFIVIARALGADPLRLMATFVASCGKPIATRQARRLTSIKLPKRTVQRSP
jgi:transcriptional regulator with XRE-family HTH domain